MRLALLLAFVAWLTIESATFLLVGVGALASVATLVYVIRLVQSLSNATFEQTRAANSLAKKVNAVDAHLGG